MCNLSSVKLKYVFVFNVMECQILSFVLLFPRPFWKMLTEGDVIERHTGLALFYDFIAYELAVCLLLGPLLRAEGIHPPIELGTFLSFKGL